MSSPPKPPKRIRMVMDSAGYIWKTNIALVDYGESYTEHFYILEEEEPMEPKKEMTAQDAWIAMAKGECVHTGFFTQRIQDRVVQYYSEGWREITTLGNGPYSIVADPSKPEPKVDEYEYRQDRHHIAADDIRLLEFIEKHFQRKGEK